MISLLVRSFLDQISSMIFEVFTNLIIDLHHDIFFFLIRILVPVLRILVRALWHFHYQKNPIPQRIVHGTTIEILRTIFPSIIPMFIGILSFALLYSQMAWCDGANTLYPPQSPGQLQQLPEEPPQTPPGAPPLPQPIVIPELEQPLLLPEIRRNALYERYLLPNFGGDGALRRMVSIIDAQFAVEQEIGRAHV